MPKLALYYPEWGISDANFLFESLLYWDRIGCIVPDEAFRPHPWHEDEDMESALREVHERYVSGCVPTSEQKMQAHDRIRLFAEMDAPEWCQPRHLQPSCRSVVSSLKLAPETVGLLRERGWISLGDRDDPLQLNVISEAAANLVMAALASECSSASMPAVTDDPGGFKASCNLLLRSLHAPAGIRFTDDDDLQPPVPSSGDYGFHLASVPHPGSPEAVSPRMLRRLLRARDDPEIDGLRSRYCERVDAYLEQLRSAEATEIGMIRDHFAHELDQDLDRLKRELRRVGLAAILSKEGLCATLLGAVTATVSSGLGLVIGLTGGLVQYRKTRQKTFEEHWTSWIFSIRAGRFTVW